MQEAAENKRKLSTLRNSAIAITSVVIAEVIVGLTVGSLAILSDGLHALLDALTSFVLFFVTLASLRPPDEEHMYGHEKFESIGGLVGGIALIGVAIVIMYEAILRIAENSLYINTGLEMAGFIVISYTFMIDFYRVGSLVRARKSESATVRIGLYHALADFCSTIIAFLGFGLATIGFYYGDSIASIVLGIMLSYLSIKLVWSSVMELSDTTSKETVDKVRKEILNTKGVNSYRDLKIRKAGNKTFVRVTIQVPEFLNLEEAHNLTQRIEENVQKALGNTETLVHIEPPETTMYTQKLVEEMTLKVKGVMETHEVVVVSTEGKLYITLHARVNPRLSVQETHDIAENIENEIFGVVKDVENVTVHIEPYRVRSRKGITVNESEIDETILRTVESYKQVFRTKKTTTYVANRKRYINIEGYFMKQTSLEEAHAITSEIESKIAEHFADTVVTVHMEPEPQLPPKQSIEDKKK
jgi:cation diffusion facilitator family transporter